jgi:hypothetical protein
MTRANATVPAGGFAKASGIERSAPSQVLARGMAPPSAKAELDKVKGATVGTSVRAGEAIGVAASVGDETGLGDGIWVTAGDGGPVAPVDGAHPASTISVTAAMASAADQRPPFISR